MAAILEFGMDTFRPTQSPNGAYSHKGREAWDFGGANYGAAGAVDKWVIPKTSVAMVVKYVQSAGDHFVYFETQTEVVRPDGTVGKVTLAMCHQDDTSRYRVGMVINPGEEMYKEGTYSGGRKNAVDPHLHVQAGYGVYAGTLLAKPYKMQNEAKLQNVMFIPDSVKVVATGGTTWKKSSLAPVTPTTPTTSQGDEEMKLRAYVPLDETARTSALIQTPKERIMVLGANKERKLYGVKAAVEVDETNISAAVEAFENADDFVPDTVLVVRDN